LTPGGETKECSGAIDSYVLLVQTRQRPGAVRSEGTVVDYELTIGGPDAVERMERFDNSDDLQQR
jgi:hypothetical protein